MFASMFATLSSIQVPVSALAVLVPGLPGDPAPKAMRAGPTRRCSTAIDRGLLGSYLNAFSRELALPGRTGIFEAFRAGPVLIHWSI